MEDRLTEIEMALRDRLLTIDTASVLPTGYTYRNTVSIINIDDEVIGMDHGDFPFITIYQDPEDIVLGGEQNAFHDIFKVRLNCAVSNDNFNLDTMMPKFAINKKMNSLWSDIKYCLSEDYQLNGTVDRVDIKRSVRVYNTNGNELRAANLQVYLEIFYSQSRLNPDINACY